MINLSYSRISLTDIAQKLQLDSPEDAEFIVAKVNSINNLIKLSKGKSETFFVVILRIFFVFPRGCLL